MKTKKILAVLVGATALTALASCDNNSKKDPSKVLSEFKTTLDAQSVKGTFKNNYNITVDAHGGTADFSSFRHEIESTVDFEFTLGDDFYLYTKKTWKDKLDAKSEDTTEALLYKVDGKYMYSTTYTQPVEVTGMNTVKLEEYLKTITAEQAGGLTLNSFIYSKGKYELDNFGLTDTFGIDEIKESTYEVNENNGLTITYKPDYVGYQTDNGMSDFAAASGSDSAADVTINTNENGYVTGWKETYHAGLDFAIMNPKPTVCIDGTRELTVTYDTEITKKTADIEHKTPVAKVSISTPQNGTVKVQSLVLDGQNPSDMKNVENRDRVAQGRYLLITPKANEGYEIDKVTINGDEITKSAFGYAYLIQDSSDIKIAVSFKEVGSTPDTPAANVRWVYSGNASGTDIVITFYDNNTFKMTCPAYNNASAGEGTYSATQSSITMTITKEGVFPGKTKDEVTMNLSSDFQTLSTDSFFNGAAVSFTYQAK